MDSIINCIDYHNNLFSIKTVPLLILIIMVSNSIIRKTVLKDVFVSFKNLSL